MYTKKTMSEVPVSPNQNIISPIDVAPISPTPDVTPKKRNYLPWILGILVLVIVFAISFLILTGKSKSTPINSLTQESPVEISEPKTTPTTPVVINDLELIKFVREYLKLGPEVQIEIKKIEGNYAYGTGGAKDGAGFYWAVAKKDGQWNYAFGGNGIPECKEVEIFPVGTFKLAGQDGKFDICYNKSELIDRKTGLPVK